MSTLDSYHYSNNTTILCIWAWERRRPSVWKRLQKKQWKRKKRYLIDVQFSTDKKLATTQDHQTLQNSDEKQDCQYWILRLVLFTRFHKNRDCLLKLYYCYQLEQFLMNFTGKNVSTLGLLHMVTWGCCDNTLLLCKTCLHAVYYGMEQRGPTTSDLRAILQKRDNSRVTCNKMM